MVNGEERKLTRPDFKIHYSSKVGRYVFVYEDTRTSKLYWTDIIDPKALKAIDIDEKFVFLTKEEGKYVIYSTD